MRVRVELNLSCTILTYDGKKAIERDSMDPQLLQNLSHFRPVKVDHHMQTIRPVRLILLYL